MFTEFLAAVACTAFWIWFASRFFRKPGPILPPVTVPPRGTDPNLGISIEVNLPNYWGSGLKNHYRKLLQNNPLAFQPVELFPRVDSIPIKTIGDWIFGIQDYEGNVRFKPDQGRIVIQVPSDAPKEVISLLRSVFPDETTVLSDSWHVPKIVKEHELTEDYLLNGRRAFPVSFEKVQ